MVSVPDLEVQSSGYLRLGLVPAEHRVLARDDDLLFGDEVVEGVDEPPVEVALAGERSAEQEERIGHSVTYRPRFDGLPSHTGSEGRF